MCHIRLRLGYSSSIFIKQNVAHKWNIMKCTPLNGQYCTMGSCSNPYATILKKKQWCQESWYHSLERGLEWRNTSETINVRVKN
jgi:hypothetical protein